MSSAKFSWMTGLLIGLGVLIVLMGAAILVVRNRRAAEPADSASANTPVYAVLDVAYADGGTKSYSVRGQTSIGRAEDNHLVLHDDAVSGRHAELIVYQNGYLLRDLGSANGTSVNGQAIAEQYLSAGDQIKMGGTTLTFRPVS